MALACGGVESTVVAVWPGDATTPHDRHVHSRQLRRQKMSSRPHHTFGNSPGGRYLPSDTLCRFSQHLVIMPTRPRPADARHNAGDHRMGQRLHLAPRTTTAETIAELDRITNLGFETKPSDNVTMNNRSALATRFGSSRPLRRSKLAILMSQKVSAAGWVDQVKRFSSSPDGPLTRISVSPGTLTIGGSRLDRGRASGAVGAAFRAVRRLQARRKSALSTELRSLCTSW